MEPATRKDTAAAETKAAETKERRSLQDLEAVLLSERSIELKSLADVVTLARILAASTYLPRDYQGKVENVVFAILMGRELSLHPIVALQNLRVMRRRMKDGTEVSQVSLAGDMATALIQQSGVLESWDETYIGVAFEDDFRAKVVMKRKTLPAVVREFSVQDAKKAGLWATIGPWTQYPRRMLAWRARWFLMRDLFSDILRGMSITEELADAALADEHALAETVKMRTRGKADAMAEPPAADSGAGMRGEAI